MVCFSRKSTIRPLKFLQATKDESLENDIDENLGFIKADDGDALQALFLKFCDVQGLLTKDALKKIPAISELLVSHFCELVVFQSISAVFVFLVIMQS